MDLSLISIITPSFNRAAMIVDAVESVLAQGYPEFEHIIVDGASTDGTLEVLKRYQHLRVVSEPDRGMYDAINKGLRLARGTVSAWLNTDDIYPPGAFAEVSAAFAAHPETPAVSGGAETFEMTATGLHILKTERAIDETDFWRRIVEAPVPNGWFFKKSLFDKIGYFDPGFRLVADRDFLIRVALAGIRPVPIGKVLYRYRMHEGSATFQAEDSRHQVYGPRRMEVNREDLRMLEGFFARPDLPRDVCQVMTHAHSEYAYRLAATALYHRRWDLVREGLSAGFRRDPFFPLALVRFSLRRLFQRSQNA
jgi:glycosyltransferase involved in cell wall biosynthesis